MHMDLVLCIWLGFHSVQPLQLIFLFPNVELMMNFILCYQNRDVIL